MRWPVLVATIATAVTAEGGALFGSDDRGDEAPSAVACERASSPERRSESPASLADEVEPRARKAPAPYPE